MLLQLFAAQNPSRVDVEAAIKSFPNVEELTAALAAADPRGYTALHLACQAPQAHVASIAPLLAAGADATTVTAADSTPLLELCANASKILPDAGADAVPGFEALVARSRPVINHRDRAGCTALHHACTHVVGSALGVSGIRLLIDGGADPTARDERGRTALHYLSYARGSGGTSSASLADAAQLLVNAGLRPDSADNNGRTAVHAAARCDHPEAPALLAALLAAAGSADAQAVLAKTADAEGHTPLHVISTRGGGASGVAITRCLISAGADVNAEDEDGRTPVDLLAATGGDAAGEIQAVLVNECGARAPKPQDDDDDDY